MIDLDAFEERAAIMEFDGGMTRFQAETEAAKLQGVTRWEALQHAKRIGYSATAQHQHQTRNRDAAVSVPTMQRGTEKQNG